MSHHILRDKSFLKTFWSIGERSIDQRVNGGSSLVKILISRQRIHEESGNSAETKERLSPEVKYALKRLVRGVASPRNHARFGFAAGLTEVLDRIRAIHMTDVFELMKAELDMKDKGIDPKDDLFGNIFAIHAIIQTQRITREKGSVVTKLVRDIKDCLKRKTYVNDICCQALIDLVGKVSEDVFHKHVWPELKADFKGWEDTYPDAAALLAVCYERFPEAITGEFMVQHYGSEDIFGERNFKNITNLLVKSTIEYQVPCNVFLDVLVAHIVKKKGHVTTFWSRVVEGGLCNQTGNPFLHVFSILERLLPHCKERDIPAVLSPSLVEQLLTRLAKRKNKGGNLRNELVEFTKKLPGIVAAMKKGSKQMAVLKGLLSSHGYTHFDGITKTKTVSGVIGQLNYDGAKLFLEWVKALFFTEPQKGDVDTLRRWIADQMISMLKNSHIPKDEAWVMDVAQFFFLHGFFEEKGASPPLSAGMREVLVGHFYTAVDLLSNSPAFRGPKDNTTPDTPTTVRHLGISADGTLRVLTMVNYAQELLSSGSVKCLKPFAAESQEAWDKMLSTVRKIQKNFSKGKTTTASLACQLLFLHIGLQCFSDPEQCTQILQDLQECFQQAMGKRAASPESGEYIEVIVDILLSLLANSSHLLRTVVELAFKMICPQLTEKSLQSILDLFDPDNNKLQSMMADDGGEESGDEEDAHMEEDAESDDDKDENPPKTNGKSAEKEEESDSSDDDEDDEGEDIGPVDEALRQKLKDALGEAAITEDTTGESEGDLTDAAMEGLDNVLADVFRINKKNSAGKQDNKHHQMGLFKLRLFHLLEIFVKKNPENPLVVRVVFPMLKVARIPRSQQDEQPLSQRAAQLLDTKICRSNTYPRSISKEQSEHVYETIEELMKLTRKGRSVTAMSLVSHCTIYMVKVLKAYHGFDGTLEKAGDLDRIKKLYLSALDDFMTVRTTNLHPGLFLDLIQRLPDVAWLLAGDFGKYMDTAVLPYRQTQACAMLAALCGHPFKGMHEERTTIMTTIQGCLCKALSSMENSPDNKPKPKVLKEVLLTSEQFSLFAHQSEQPPDLSELIRSLGNIRTWNKAKQLEGVLACTLSAANNTKKNKKKRKAGPKQQGRQVREGPKHQGKQVQDRP